MQKSQQFSITKRIKSVSHALNGLRVLITEEHNARIHLIAAIISIIAGVAYDISRSEWLAITFAIGFVLAMEAVNTAIENIANYVQPNTHPQIKVVKDQAATAVLISALTSVIIALIIFTPKI